MKSGKQYLSFIQAAVDKKMDAMLPKERSVPQRLHAAMRYSVFSGGKRIRPAFCIAACEALGGTIKDAIVPACAIEILHTYTLIHDDLPAMDDDDMRRGKPSLHKAFDEATAILAGDALLTMAFAWLAQGGDMRTIATLAAHAGSAGTIGGQIDDLAAKDMAIEKKQLLFIHRRKTAALFAASCTIGALCARASEKDIDAMGSFGNAVGMAFQLFDDIVDNDPITMRILTKEEALRAAHARGRQAEKYLASISGNTEQLHELGRFALQSFAV